MLKQLQKIFPSLIVYHAEHESPSAGYQWFLTDENEIIGIDKKELTNKDTSLLSAFLSPYNFNFPIVTEQEQIWKKRINGEYNQQIVKAYRFVYFSFKKNQISPKSFKNAINEFFARSVAILWENEHEGIIIEEQSQSNDENISYEQIIDVLMSDLYVKINFLVGPYQKNLENIHQYYTSLMKGAKIAFSYSNKQVITYTDAILYFLVDEADSSFREEVTRIVLQEFAGDKELLRTIKTFIQCNLNVSVTAKELYMHRNSLQYRLDKFTEKTGIDIRQFHQAMTVYLALLVNMH
ncbi:PucR family transcriptional regulator [Virgibacillus ainsalahensis]